MDDKRNLKRVRDRSNKRAAYWRQNLNGLALAARERWEKELQDAGDIIPTDILFTPQRTKNLLFLVWLRENEDAALNLRLQAVTFMLEHDLGKPPVRLFSKVTELKTIEIISDGHSREITLSEEGAISEEG